jgi:uncharacterized membrane-anchored protein
MKLPPDHPLRAPANAEVHARPADVLLAPLRLSYLALFSTASHEQEWQQLCELTQHFKVTPPTVPSNHFSADLGRFRIRWERHTEFVRYTFIVGDVAEQPFTQSALSAVPAQWLSALKGQIIVAAHVELTTVEEDAIDFESLSQRLFSGNPLVGSGIAGGTALAITDFQVGADGFSRLLVNDHGMTPRQAGRMLQILLELDTYRMLALLALPAARQLTPFLGESERELSAVTSKLASAAAEDESALLDRLTRLEAQIESRRSDNLYRFDAASAYYELVHRRIAELRETRMPGLPTFEEFVERRLAPAMNTCRAVAARQLSLSERVARANQLLSTRVDITREQQNQALLESMNRRAQLQLRLQQTVEGLSIAAVTYYIVGLLGYAAKGFKAAGLPVNPDIFMAVGIPLVAVLVALAIRKTRRVVERSAD